MSAISSFFEFLIVEAEDDAWRNPVRWKRHSVRTGHHLPRDVSDETADEALLAVINDPRDRAIFTLILRAGLRVGEVVSLTLSDIEPLVQYKLARLRGCGKGGKEPPTWLTQEAWLELAAWLKVRPESNSQTLFLNQHARPLSVSVIQYRLKQYRQQAGRDLSCHQLCHTFARRLAEQQMPVDSLAKLLGHNDLQTTHLYIDGTASTVRQDFEQGLLDRSLSDPPTASLTPGSLPAISLIEKRPDPDLVLQQVSHLTAAVPAWLAQAELTVFRAFWRDLLDQERVTNEAMLSVKAPQGSE